MGGTSSTAANALPSIIFSSVREDRAFFPILSGKGPYTNLTFDNLFRKRVFTKFVPGGFVSIHPLAPLESGQFSPRLFSLPPI